MQIYEEIECRGRLAIGIRLILPLATPLVSGCPINFLPTWAVEWELSQSIPLAWPRCETLWEPPDQRPLPTPRRTQRQRTGDMVAASTWQPRQPSFEGTNATDQTSTAPAARAPGPAREMVRQPFFENGRRPASCRLPSITTSRRCRDQPRS